MSGKRWGRLVRLTAHGLPLTAVTALAQANGAAPRSLWAASASVATVHLSDTTSLAAFGGVITYRPRAWLTLGAAPAEVQTKAGTVSTSGFGDLPLTAAVSAELPTARGPELAAAAVLMLPTGDATRGLGRGITTVAIDVGAGVSPADAVHLYVDASRSLSGVTLSSFDAPESTWLSVDGTVDVTGRLAVSASWGGDLGGVDSVAAAREAGAGVRYALHGPLAISVDVTHRLSGDAPTWGLVVTFGTVGNGLSPLETSSPLGRQQNAFVGGATVKCHGRSRVCP